MRYNYINCIRRRIPIAYISQRRYSSYFTVSFPLFLSQNKHVRYVVFIEFGISRFEQKKNTKLVWLAVFDRLCVINRQTKNPFVFQTLLTPEIEYTRWIIYRTDLWRGYFDYDIAIGVDTKTNYNTHSRHFIKHSKPYGWRALLKCTVIYSDIVVHYT